MHRYPVVLEWAGSTADGYDAYERAHAVRTARAGSAATWSMSADAGFGGDVALANPEDLLVASASSCQLLSFLAVAARARVIVREYRDEAIGEMPSEPTPMRLTRITLRPRVVLGGSPPRAKVERLMRIAHEECFIAASLTTEIVIEPHWVGLAP